MRRKPNRKEPMHPAESSKKATEIEPRRRPCEYRETCITGLGAGGDGASRARMDVPDPPRLESLREITTDSANAVREAPGWEELDMMVDSGASDTVINTDMVKAVEAQDAKPNVRYEVADGSLVKNMD